ncbi:MAG: P1 family peptidase [Bacteroidales bacterium]|nr:P1 family peptidase [Candidatus Egerieousia equi]
MAVAACAIMVAAPQAANAQKRMRDYGIVTGVMKPGKWNAITDVPGVKVGHVTINNGEGGDKKTGVTAIVQHDGNIFRKKVPAAIYAGNGFGKLSGVTQVKELGNIETPIILTNTLNVAEGIAGLVEYTLAQPGNERVQSVNAVVGETNDGGLNNIRARYVTKEDVKQAIANAKSGPVEEGAVGAGTGTVAFGIKGGIGTASRVLPKAYGGYTVGVLVQSNYGGVLEIDGVQVGQLMRHYNFRDKILQDVDGSCMMVVITDAPVDARNLERMAKRAMLGLAKTGGIASNGSGDYVIAMSVCPENLIDESTKDLHPTLLHNDDMSPLFLATIEATAEALWNSIFVAEPVTGYNGYHVDALDNEQTAKWILNAKKAVGLDKIYKENAKKNK